MIMSSYEIKLNWDVAHMVITEGDHKVVKSGDNRDFVTRFDFLLPLKSEEIQTGKYTFEYKGTHVDLLIEEIKNNKDDILYQKFKNWSISSGISGQPPLKYDHISDSRGRYPCYLVRLAFHSRIARWVFPGGKDDKKYKEFIERAQVIGPPHDEDKIAALAAINSFLKSDKYPIDVTTLATDENVTNYLELYFLKKGSHDPIHIRQCALTSKDAFRNATLDAIFQNGYQPVFAALAFAPVKTHFGSEEELHGFNLETIDNVLVHHIENRQWIEPFWDGKRKFKIGDESHQIPARPKPEPKIQPTFDVIFHEAFGRHGIAVTRESDEGVGELDFCFSCTSDKGQVLRTNLELKLAQHKKLEHGLSTQLPAYMRANQCSFGIYVVLWFKDEQSKYFKEPKAYNKPQTKEFLERKALEVKEATGYEISVRVIDASIRPSASEK